MYFSLSLRPSSAKAAIPSAETYLRPDAVSSYNRPDGISIYKRP